jgi:hypothetical protein
VTVVGSSHVGVAYEVSQEVAGLVVVVIVFVFAVAGRVAGSWLTGRLDSSRATPSERLRRYQRDRVWMTTCAILVTYYLPAVLVSRLRKGGSWSAVGDYFRGHVLDAFGMAAFAALTWKYLFDRDVPEDQRLDRASSTAAVVAGLLAAIGTFAAGGPILWVGGAAVAVGFSMFWFWYLCFGEVLPKERSLQQEISAGDGGAADSNLTTPETGD